jgi:stress response protein YsnF
MVDVPQSPLPGDRPGPSSFAPLGGEVPGLAALGGGPAAARATGTLRALTGDVAQILLREQEKAEQVAFMDAEAKLSALETDVVHGQDGLFSPTFKGRNAFRAPDALRNRWETGVREIEKGLGRLRVKDAFRRSVTARKSQLDRQTVRHVAGEATKFDRARTSALVANEMDSLGLNYDMPEMRELSFERMEQAITAHALRNGVGKESLELSLRTTKSGGHMTVLNAMTSEGNDLQAIEYFKSIPKGELTARDKAKATSLLQETSTRAAAAGAVDKIMAQDLSVAEARKRVRAINNIQVRDEASRRLERRLAQRAQEKGLDIDRLWDKARRDMLENGADMDPRVSVSPSTWEEIKEKAPDMIRKLRASMEPQETNQGIYFNFLDLMRRNPAALADMTESSFRRNFWTHVNSRDQKWMEGVWLSATQAKQKSLSAANAVEKELKEREEMALVLKDSDQIENVTLGTMNQEEKATYLRFIQQVDLEKELMSAQKRAEGKPGGISRDELSDIMNRVVNQQAVERVPGFEQVGGPLSSLFKKVDQDAALGRFFNLPLDERGRARLPEKEWEAIPQLQKDRWRKRLETNFVNVTPELLHEFGSAVRFRMRSTVERILASGKVPEETGRIAPEE